MKVGIIASSYTGNTMSVAQRLGAALEAAGHEVTISKIEPMNDNPNSPDAAAIKTAPDVSPYDAIVFASPVHAFSLARITKNYLDQVSDLRGEKVYCFVTQRLKKAWMGGNHALKQMKKACLQRGAAVVDSGVVNWSSDIREKQIENIISQFTKM